MPASCARGHEIGGDARTIRREMIASPRCAESAVRADVRFDHWSEDRGQRVAHLTMTAHTALDESLAGMQMNGEGRWRGSYAVLASGRLLSAEIEKDLDATLDSTIAGKASTQKHKMHATMKLHLVGACDGPTAPRLIPEPTLEERAIVSYADTYMAILKGDKDKALAGFDPVLRKKHGDGAIWTAVSGYRSERDEGALGVLTFLRDEDVSADGTVVRLKLQGTTQDGSSTLKVRTPLVLEVVLREEGGRFMVTSLRSDLVIAKGRLLEISPTALAVRRGWPPR